MSTNDYTYDIKCEPENLYLLKDQVINSKKLKLSQTELFYNINNQNLHYLKSRLKERLIKEVGCETLLIYKFKTNYFDYFIKNIQIEPFEIQPL